MKNYLAILVLFTVSLFAFAAIDHLPNLQNPRFQFYTAGQPDEDGFKRANAMGIKSVINVLPQKECLPGEEAVVTQQNMTYTAFPFEATKLNMEMVQKFAALLNQQEKPVLIHCSTGNHVGGLWFAYRVLSEKAPLGVALKEARAIGMKPEMEEAIFNWVVNERENLTVLENVGSD
jgi:uncharacterized protein (TIGR01244 family)